MYRTSKPRLHRKKRLDKKLKRQYFFPAWKYMSSKPARPRKESEQ